MKKLITEQNLKKDRLSGFFLTLLVLIVAVLAVTRVVIANRLVEASEKLRVFDQTIAQIEKTNQNLSETLRGPSSITQIEEKAKTLGFVPTSHLVFLTKTPEMALETNLSRTLR